MGYVSICVLVVNVSVCVSEEGVFRFGAKCVWLCMQIIETREGSS